MRPVLGTHGGCGGTVKVKDWNTSASRDFRYEAYCEKCNSCDPNGYSSMKKTRVGAAEYFHIVASNAAPVDAERKG